MKTNYGKYIDYLANFNLPKRQKIHNENLLRFSSKKTGNKNIDNYVDKVTSWTQTKTYSMSDFNVQTITTDSIKEKFGRNWKFCLKTMYPIVYKLYWENYHSTNGIKEVFLSCCSNCFVERVGSSSSVNRLFHKLEAIDCIHNVPFIIDGKEYSTSFGGNKFRWCREHGYGYGETYKSKFQGVSKHYIIHPVVIDVLYKWSKELFGVYHWRTLLDDATSLDFDRDDYLKYVKILEKAFFKNGVYVPFARHNIRVNQFPTRHKFELYSIRFMYENDIRFRYATDLRKQLNENIMDVDLKDVFEPTFHYSPSGETCTKIGIRNWCNMATFKSHESKDVVELVDGEYVTLTVTNNNYKGKMFKDECIKKFGCTGKEFDSNGNIPRVLYFMNYGKWLPQNVCMYEKMFGVSFNNNKFIKKLHKSVALPALFTSSPDEYIYKTSLYYDDKEREIQKEAQKFGEVVPDEFANYTWEKVHELFPVISGTECFFVESIIFMLLEKQLQDMGIKDYIIKYDAVYLFHGEEIDFNAMLTNAANQYKEMFMSNVQFPPEPVTTKQKEFGYVSCIDNLRI